MKARSLIAANFTPEEILNGKAKVLLNLIPREELTRIQFLVDIDMDDKAEDLALALLEEVRSKISPQIGDHFLLSRPILVVSAALHRHIGLHPVISKYSIAWSVVFAGAYMATNPYHSIPHFLWDGIAYTIHGFGAAPIAESMIRKITNRH